MNYFLSYINNKSFFIVSQVEFNYYIHQINAKNKLILNIYKRIIYLKANSKWNKKKSINNNQ